MQLSHHIGMKLSINSPKKQTSLVEEGLHTATVVSETQLEKANKEGQKLDLEIEFQLEKFDAKLKRRYHPILELRGNLRHDIERMYGRALTHDELRDFDSEDLIGKKCQIVVTHTSDNAGNVKAQICAVLAAPAPTPADAPIVPAQP